MKKDTQETAFRQRVLTYQQNGHSVTETANRYHISRKTVYKWRKRWDGTRESLEDRSRRPKHSPRQQTEAEIKLVEEKCKELGVNVVLSQVWAKGGEGGKALAEEVIRLVEEPSDFRFSYELTGSIEDKLNQIATKIYGARGVVMTADAAKQAKQLEDIGFGNLPICVAKTQYSLTDDPKKLGAPKDFDITVRGVKVSAGAGFVVALTGEIMTMPGLPKVPAATKIDVDENGKITGLF